VYLVENWWARGFHHGHCHGGVDLGYDLFGDLLIFPWREVRVKMMVDHLGETVVVSNGGERAKKRKGGVMRGW
jgi:hypothetical protein